MKIITLHQPWATLIALGFKQYETRTWATKYRGTIAIHAAKRKVKKDELAQISYDSIGHLPWKKISQIEYPLGAIVAIADLSGCQSMINACPLSPIVSMKWISILEQSPLERAVGDWHPGRYAWKLSDVIALPEPIPYKGNQGIGNVSEEVQQQIKAVGER